MSEFSVNKDIELLKSALIKQRELREKDYWRNQIPGLSPPVLWFGDSNKKAPLITVGANPSRREFLDRRNGSYLKQSKQRFYHLKTPDVQEILNDEGTLRKIIESYIRYFDQNPYWDWFGKPSGYKVEGFLNGFGASFYGSKSIGAVHTDLLPFVTMSDFSELNESALKVDLFCNGWACNFFEKLMAHLNPSTLIVFGRKNTEYFDRYFQSIALNKSYKINGKKKAEYGISRFKLLSHTIPLVGLSTNLGNPRSRSGTFTEKMLNEFGAHIKGEIDHQPEEPEPN